MSHGAEYPASESDEESEVTITEAHLSASAEPLSGKVEVSASARGPAKTVTSIAHLVAGVALIVGAGPVILAGTGTAYVGWFIALAVVMTAVGVTLLLRRRS